MLIDLLIVYEKCVDVSLLGPLNHTRKVIKMKKTLRPQITSGSSLCVVVSFWFD